MSACTKGEDLSSFKISNGILYKYLGDKAEVIIPNSVIKIGEEAFLSSKITSVVIPCGVREIRDRAFAYCFSLKSLSIANDVTLIGKNAFDHCRSLTQVVIPNSVIKIDSNAFESCNALTNISLSNNLRMIDKGVFLNCEALSEINLPDGLFSISDSAFGGCKSLTNITIPKNVNKIGFYAFHQTGLKTARVPKACAFFNGSFPSSCEIIRY